jgi:hypothetical protein
MKRTGQVGNVVKLINERLETLRCLERYGIEPDIITERYIVNVKICINGNESKY